MRASTPILEKPSKSTFPSALLENILRKELEEAAEESAVLHGGWEPVLDSLRMVTIIATFESLFDFGLPPEKIIKKGGYKSVEEAFENITTNLRILSDKHQK